MSSISRGANLVFAFVFFVLCLRGVLVGPWMLLDADLGWHLAYGREIVATGTVPTTDEWSWTSFGTPYQLTQWGGQALLGVAYALGSAGGLHVLFAATVALTMRLLFKTCATFVESKALSTLLCFAVPVLLWAGVVRPTMFTWFLMAWLAWHVAQAAREWHAGHILAIPVVIAVWTNLHGSYVIGVAAALAALTAFCLDQRSKGRHECAWLAGYTALACLAATALNPYGLDVWRGVMKVASLESTRGRYFADWKATELMSAMGAPAWCAVAAGVTCLIRRRGWQAMVASAATVALCLSAQRNAALAAVLATGLVAYAVAGSALDRAFVASHWPTMRAWSLSGRSGVLVSSMLGVALVGLFGASEAREERAESAVFPIVCRNALVGRDAGTRLLNEFEHGGWWIRRGAGVKVSIDGRADLHGDEAFDDLRRIKEAGDGWETRLNRLNPEAICLSATSNLFAKLRSRSDYRMAAADGTWQLWLKARQD